jgi:hemoglobin-like flavoprotein
MFSIGMSHQRDRLLSALGRIVAQFDNLADLLPFVRQLGADHRKFGVEALHYPEVGQSLVATLRYFSGAAWTEALARDWTDAYTLLAKVMVEAAEEDAKQRAPDRRRPGEPRPRTRGRPRRLAQAGAAGRHDDLRRAVRP